MVLDIAVHGREGPVQMRDIARRQNISQKYLEKIIRTLKQAGIIESVRGPKGGHCLARPPERITVGDVVRVLEGDCALVDCEKDEKACTHSPGCLTRLIWKEGSQAMFERFDAITLAELIEYQDRGVKFGDFCDATMKEWGNQDRACDDEASDDLECDAASHA